MIGSGHNDRILGTGGVNVFDGGGGDDQLFGGLGADTLNGGDGNDLAHGWVGDDLLTGGSGNDTLKGEFGNDTLVGGSGNDTFVFTNGFGADVIDDFEATNNAEVIDLSGVSEISDFTDLKDNHMSQVGSDVVIATSDGTITLLNTALSDLLDGNDFTF